MSDAVTKNVIKDASLVLSSDIAPDNPVEIAPNNARPASDAVSSLGKAENKLAKVPPNVPINI
ncbi:MAG: hypothetical protein RLZZ210_1777 [Pseudomonadota bacterium]